MPPFVPRERKHRRLAKQKDVHFREAGDHADSNAPTILPVARSERERRRHELAQELRAQQTDDGRISGKKRKRLDKYVDTKLRKEENLHLLKKLAAHKVDTSLLRSSKTLGKVTETKRDRISRALREQQAGIDVDGTRDEILYQKRKTTPEHEVSWTNDRLTGTAKHDSVSGNSDSDEAIVPSASTSLPATLPDPPPKTPSFSFGSGLKRAPNESAALGARIIRKRKRRTAGATSGDTIGLASHLSHMDESGLDVDESNDENEDVWNGFSSEGSSVADTQGIGGSSDESTETPDTDDESGAEADADRGQQKQRVSAFKAWADAQRNTAADFTPSTVIVDAAVRASFRPRPLSPELMPPNLAEAISISTARPTKAITIDRSPNVQDARLRLPVVQEEQKIMEAVNANAVVIVCGATGSGKTTQVPQMLLENGYGSRIGEKEGDDDLDLPSKGIIGVTQPRRVAATSVAARVAEELGPKYGPRVGHQVRYDTNVGRNTAIKFMTDGILLREIDRDFILSKYSVIVIDEAHERSVNSDILIGMLSRIAPLRAQLAIEEPTKHYPLKLIIMSATLRVADFAENKRLFKEIAPPILQAEGRQFSVTEHFSRKTHRDFVTEMTSKVARGHRKLPAGSILVFLTSQNDIQTVARKLKVMLGGNTMHDPSSRNDTHPRQMPLEADDFESFHDTDMKRDNDYIEENESDEESDAEITGLDDEDDEFQVEDEQPSTASKAPLKPYILPLYAALPASQQMKVFQPPSDGTRMIVLATNVAETSLTIPGIRYVFDCGRSKEKKYDPVHGIQTFEVDWISKASAAQRAGRAGRTGPGHVYRLYSSAVYEQFFAEHSVPEILRTPLESTVLQLKNMSIENVVNFPFPTPPDAVYLQQAERLLNNLGAIGKQAKITEIGKEIMGYPVNPRFGKILLLAQRNQILGPMIAVVAGLAVGELFTPHVPIAPEGESEVEESDDEPQQRRAKRALGEVALQQAKDRQKAYGHAHATLARWDDQSDVLKLLTAVAAYGDACSKHSSSNSISHFCEDLFLREKGMAEVQHLRQQLHNIVNAQNLSQMKPFSSALSPPSKKEITMINQIVAAGHLDQVAIRADLLRENTATFGRAARRATEVAYKTLVPSAEVDKTLDMHEQSVQQSVFVHPSSVLARLSVPEMPGYIIYSHLSQAAPKHVGASSKVIRTRIHPLTTIGPKSLAGLAEGTPLLELGKPLGRVEEISSIERRCWVGVSLKSPIAGGQVWPLATWKVSQKRKAGVWDVEKVLTRQ